MTTNEKINTLLKDQSKLVEIFSVKGENFFPFFKSAAFLKEGTFEQALMELTGVPPELSTALVKNLEANSLLEVVSIDGVKPKFVKLNQGLLNLLRSLISDGELADYQDDFTSLYLDIAGYLYQTAGENPKLALKIAEHELGNLREALDIFIEDEAFAEAVDLADSIEFFLEKLGRTKEQQALSNRMESLQKSSDGLLSRADYMQQTQKAEKLKETGRVKEAEEAFSSLLNQIRSGQDYSGDQADFDQAVVLFHLGHCKVIQGSPLESVTLFSRSLSLIEEVKDKDEQMKRMQSVCLIESANVLNTIGDIRECKKKYLRAIKIFEELKETKNAGVIKGQLGSILLEHGDTIEAEKYLNEAMTLFEEIKEVKLQSVYSFKLGMLKLQGEFWEDAIYYLDITLELEKKLGDKAAIINCLIQLGRAYQGMTLTDAAESCLKEAAKLSEATGDRKSLALCNNNLANLSISEEKFDEAEKFAQKSLSISEAVGIENSEIWKDYALLAQIAEKRGDNEAKTSWKKLEQDSFAQFSGASQLLPEWTGGFVKAIISVLEGGEKEKKEAKSLLDGIEKSWPALCAVSRRIVAGDKDANQHDLALSYLESYIVGIILTQLETKQTQADPASGNEEEITLDNFLETVEKACQEEGDNQLKEQLKAITQVMMTQVTGEDEVQASGRIFNEILSGNMTPDLSTVSQELAGKILDMLNRLKK